MRALGVVLLLPSLAEARPETLAAGQHAPQHIAVDGKSVYWANEGDGTVSKVPLGGGTPMVLAAGQKKPLGMAVDEKFIYWASRDGVMKASVGGGPVEVLAVVSDVLDLVADDRSLYFAVPTRGVVMSVPKSGGATVTLAENEKFPIHLAVDDQHLYWISNRGVRRTPKQGNIAKTLFGTRVTLGGLALDDKSVYLSVSFRDVMVGRKSGGKPRPLAKVGEFAHPGALAVDAESVYVLTSHDVVRINKRSGSTARLASDLISPMGIAVDRSWVYFSDRADNRKGMGTILRVKK
jgi:sugar lactone lactonase YvrE